MVLVGIVLLLLGLFVSPLLLWIGVAILVIGLILNVGPWRSPYGGGRYWW